MTYHDSRQLQRLPADHVVPPTPRTDYRLQVSHDAADAEWDAFLAATPGGHYLQSSMWARVKATIGWRPARVTVRQGERIVAGAQLLARPLPAVGAIGYAPRGPLIGLDDPWLPAIVLDALRQIVAEQRIQYLLLHAPYNGQTIAQQLPSWGYRPTVHKPRSTATVRVDLPEDLDTILARMKKKTRQHIRHGLREGIVVREGDQRDLPIFHRLMLATGERQSFGVHAFDYFERMWQVMAPGGHIKLFLAEYIGEPVCAQLAVPFGDTVLYHSIGWSGRHANLRPNEVMYWWVMTWAKGQGYRYCDFDGIDLKAATGRGPCEAPDAPVSPADERLTSYKLGFGGTVIPSPFPYEYIRNPLLAASYRAMAPKIAHWSSMRKIKDAIRGVGGKQTVVRGESM